MYSFFYERIPRPKLIRLVDLRASNKRRGMKFRSSLYGRGELISPWALIVCTMSMSMSSELQ